MALGIKKKTRTHNIAINNWEEGDKMKIQT